MVGKKLGILFLAAVILSFLTGYFSQSLLPAFQTGNPSDSFDLITDKIKRNYYYEIDANDIDQAYVDALQSVVSTYARLNNDPYTRLIASPKSSGGSYSDESFIGIGITFVFEGNLLNIEDVELQSDAFGKFIAGDQIIGIVENQVEVLFANLNSQSDVLQKLTGVLGETKTLIVRTRDQLVKHVNIEYKELLFPSVIASNDFHPNLGYIKINQFNGEFNELSPGTSFLFSQALQSLEAQKLNSNSENKTLIIDVRDNPGGALTALHNEGTQAHLGILQQLLRRNLEKPMFSMIPRDQSQATHFYGTRTTSKSYNIAVLVNENSASAAEVLAATLWNTGGYQIYGQPTFGKNVYQNSTRLFEYKNVDYILTYTEGKWFYDINKDVVSHPIDINLIDQKGIKTLDLPIYQGELSLDFVSKYLVSYQRYLNYYFQYNDNDRLRTDGYFDEQTKDAIETYQIEQGLSVTGTLNYETALSMFILYKEALEDYTNDIQLMELILELTT